MLCPRRWAHVTTFCNPKQMSERWPESQAEGTGAEKEKKIDNVFSVL